MRTLIRAAVRVIILIMSFHLLVWLIGTLFNFSHIRFANDPSAYYFVVLPLVLSLGCAVMLYILWRNTDWLVETLVGDVDDTGIVINTTNLDLITAVIRLLGIILIFTTIPELAGRLANLYMTKNAVIVGSPMSAAMVGGFVQNGFAILVGVWLLFGGRGIVEMVNRQVDKRDDSNVDNSEDT